MAVNITMPALSPTMEEGNLAKWLVKEGDQVSPGDVIAEIETDKATMEVEAVEEGTLAKILVGEGSEGVKVNAVIAVLAEEGEDASELDGPVDGGTDLDTTAPAPEPDDLQPETSKKTSVDDAHAHGKPDMNGAAREANRETSNSSDKVERNGGERVFASPLARRMAKQNEIDLSSLNGSGPRGRIVKADIEAKLSEGQVGKAEERSERPSTEARAPAQQSSTAPSTAPGAAPDDDQVVGLFEDGTFERKPHDGMRRTIAERLTQSTQTVPAYFITVECRIDKLLSLRAEINGAAPERDGEPAYRVSVNDFVVKALAKALTAVPMANASWTSTDRLLHKHADVGVAVAVEDGLFTPIVRRAEEKSLSAISAEIRDLAARARSKKLKPHEYQGGVTAVSNLGMFGVKEFTSIINPPHASILSVGAGEKRPVVDGDSLAIGTVMAATFAFDHRVIDGALGAELAAAFRDAIEQPLSMLV